MGDRLRRLWSFAFVIDLNIVALIVQIAVHLDFCRANGSYALDSRGYHEWLLLC